MNARRLFVVEDAFTIEGRGLLLLPGIVTEGTERCRVGDPIVLKKPDGSSVKTDDVPIGTEVWSV